MKKYKYTITLFVFFAAINLSGQNTSKKEYLLDENGNSTTLEKFKAKLSPEYTYGIMENDTAVIAKIVLREEKGKLNAEQVEEIKTTLKILTDSNIDDNQTIIIHFFYKPSNYTGDSCIDNYTGDAKYKRFINKNPQYARFNLTEKGYKINRKNVFEDITNSIYRYLLYGSACGNYIIIKPDGSYLKQIGEYRQNEIPKKLNEGW